MFYGTYQHKLDPKGRVILPAKFRDSFQDGVLLTKGHENSILIFSQMEGKSYIAKLRNLSPDKKNARKVIRMTLALTSLGEIDKQGRIMLPEQLRKLAGLKEKVTILGVDKHLEVWDAKAWQAYFADAESLYEDLTEDLAEEMGGGHF